MHVEQFAQRILPFLGRAADRVEKTEIFLCHLRSIPIDNRLPNAPLHFFRLAAEHGGLICHPNGSQMHVGIEPRRMRALEICPETPPCRRRAGCNRKRNRYPPGSGRRDNVLSVAERARAGRLGLFVFGLAVNDRSSRLARVFTHPFPDAHHVAAGRIDNLAAAILDLLQDRELRAERGHDDDVFRLQIGNLRLLVFPGQVLDA